MTSTVVIKNAGDAELEVRVQGNAPQIGKVAPGTEQGFTLDRTNLQLSVTRVEPQSRR